jgi:hypothetical protein
VTFSTHIKVVPILKEQSDNSLYLSKQLLNKWKLKVNVTINVMIGKQARNLIIQEHQIDGPEVHIPDHLFLQWHLPQQTYHFNCQYSEIKKTLYLAPVICLLTEVTEQDPDQPHFRSVHSFCEELEHVTKNLGGFFYVFSLQSLSNDYITGYFIKDGSWCKASLPFPNVIYNRIHSRKVEASDMFRSFRDQLRLNLIPMFNDRFLSKWEVYDVLLTEEHLQPYIPHTKLLHSTSLTEMLQLYDLLFLKPIHGSQGRNIIRIKRSADQYELHFSSHIEESNDFHVSTINKLSDILSSYIRKSTYLIQQGIPFIQHENRMIDFRVLCHKNHQDVWKVTSVVARLSAEKQFVSNIARGGETMRPLHALSLCFDKNTANQQFIFMKELALEIASIINQNTEGLTGELGIDMGIDTLGHPWLIEVNSKPSKNFEEQEIKIRPSAKAIISYCFKLAIEGFLQNHNLDKD